MLPNVFGSKPILVRQPTEAPKTCRRHERKCTTYYRSRALKLIDVLEQFDLKVLNEFVLATYSPLSCIDNDINDFFANESVDYAKQLLGRSYCFVDSEQRKIVCAFSLSNASIRSDNMPGNRRNKLNRSIPNVKRRSQYPAVLIGQLGVHKQYAGNHLGQEILEFIVSWLTDSSYKTIARYVIVDAVNSPKVLDFYENFGFKFLFGSSEEEYSYLPHHISDAGTLRTRLMYFDLLSIK